MRFQHLHAALGAAAATEIIRRKGGTAPQRIDEKFERQSGAGCTQAACYCTFNCLVAVPAFLGSVSSSTPLLYFASAFASSMSCARLKLRYCLP